MGGAAVGTASARGGVGGVLGFGGISRGVSSSGTIEATANPIVRPRSAGASEASKRSSRSVARPFD